MERRLRRPRRQLFFFGLLVGVLGIEMFPQKGLRWPVESDPDPASRFYDELAGLGAGPVLEWPLAHNDDGALSMERSIRHRQSIVNGAASYYWKGYQILREKCRSLDTSDAKRAVEAFGVRYLVIHGKKGSFPDWARDRLHEFRLVRRAPSLLLYENPAARTRFAPDDYLRRLEVRVDQRAGRIRFRLWLRPSEEWFVTREKRVIPLRFEWPDHPVPSFAEAVVAPTLWSDRRIRTLQVHRPERALPRAVFARDHEGREVELPVVERD